MKLLIGICFSKGIAEHLHHPALHYIVQMLGLVRAQVVQQLGCRRVQRVAFVLEFLQKLPSGF